MALRPSIAVTTRVALLGNQELYRLGLRRLLESIRKITVVDDQPLTLNAMARVKPLNPDLIVLDLGGGTHTQLGFLAKLAKAAAGTPIVLISQETCTGCVAALTRLDVQAILSTWSSRQDFIEAISRARGGERYLSADLLTETAPEADHPSRSLDRLSARQRQILEFIGHGLGVSEIAEKLGLSVKTIETHRARAQQILGLASASALTVFAAREMRKRENAAPTDA
ncbi:MAG TPA: response regulator transcription factor [Nevskiaceae bacterium]|nr:response regulator transcription factor [Nevskiaceae bacterium]